MKALLRIALSLSVGFASPLAIAAAPAQDSAAKSEHDMIGAGKEDAATHTMHPDAQWYPDAALGLFIHWGLSSVKSMNISWPMIPGRAFAAKQITDPAEQQRIIREGDWNLDGKPNGITPNEYWEMAKSFNPTNFDPDKWMKAAHDAGFTYAVLTTRHHEGFAMWPSKYGNFNTSNYAGGRDLVKEFVKACRKNNMKVGLYYSPPDWHFDRDYMTFLYHGAYSKNPWLPQLDGDLKVRTSKHSPEEIEAHQKAFAEEVNGQIEELLTRYGKIDLIWFDGKPAVGNQPIISQERIRELQPGILINPRLHGHGDFVTYERKLTPTRPVKGWAEFCDPWTGIWSHSDNPFRAPGFVLGELARSRALGVNFLLGVGPMSNGEFCEDIYKNMTIVGEWMKTNGEAIHATKPLAESESANVPAVASASARYLFALPTFKGNGIYEKDLLPSEDVTLSIKGIATKPASAKLLGDGSELKFEYVAGEVKVELPAAKRTKMVDVVKIELES
jgi:alpha-L-fucosidase